MISTDVVILGGGCVGLTLALALAKQNISVALIDAQQQQQPLTAMPQLRVSALSSASEAIFRRLDVWQQIDAERSTPYQQMKVWDKDSFGSISFSSTQINYPQLGHIVENLAIRNALVDKLEQLDDGITLLFEHKVEKINVGEREVLISLDDGTPVIGQLLVGADGANSFVRQQMQMPITHWDYQHHGIVATVKTGLDHQGCASQCFNPEGPLAFLPLFNPTNEQNNQQKFSSIVWSTSPERAQELLSCTQKQFENALCTAFDGQLGLCELQSERLSFPLKMRYARQWVKPRVALIGDAAHTIHPLAGLGMNLGLLDAASLAQVLIQLNEKGADLGEVANLRGFERWRKAEALTYIAAMEALKRLFQGSNPVVKLIRGSGLVLADKLIPAKEQIIKQAMGLVGELPELAKPLIQD